jgi:NTP pyrophosphatase (non-canonical NTP hydrolase)
MEKNLISVSQLSCELKRFVKEREWSKFHSPKNLVMALTGEVGEINEIFQWLTEDESRSVASDSEIHSSIKYEIADILMYLVLLADSLDIDLNSAVHEKIRLNEKRYPTNICKGSAKKSDL